MSGNNNKKFPKKLLAYLEKNKIDPKILEHRTVYTSIDVANTLKRKLDGIVKSLLVKADDYYYIVCLPADHNLDFKKIKTSIEKIAGKKVKTVLIPNEKTMTKVLNIKNEGLTAFGGFYKLPVIIEKKLANLKKAVFSSGNFNHSLEMGVREFSRLENAFLAKFGIKKKVKIINAPKSLPLAKKGANKKMAKKKKVAKKKVVKKPAKKTAKKKVVKKKVVKRPAKKAAKKKVAKKRK